MAQPHDRLITGFILAGGAGRRMGADKARLPWRDGTLLEHMSALLTSVADKVRVVGRDPLPDRYPGRGPVEGIATALSETQTVQNLIVAVDLPLLDEALLRYLALRLRTTSRNLLVCDAGGRIPLCCGARPGLLPLVDTYLESGGRSFRGLVENVEHEMIDADALRVNGIGERVFENLNTPDDYSRLTGG